MDFYNKDLSHGIYTFFLMESCSCCCCCKHVRQGNQYDHVLIRWCPCRIQTTYRLPVCIGACGSTRQTTPGGSTRGSKETAVMVFVLSLCLFLFCASRLHYIGLFRLSSSPSSLGINPKYSQIGTVVLRCYLPRSHSLLSRVSFYSFRKQWARVT